MSFQTRGRGCFNCGDASHQARDCPKKGTPTCYNCGGQGHVSRECTVAPKEKPCYRCSGVGHISRDCPQAPSGDGYSGATGGQELGMDMVAVNTLATLAVVMVTWLVIAPTVRSVTTVERLDMSRGIVPLKPGVNGFAINKPPWVVRLICCASIYARRGFGDFLMD
ncbi:hypothetical protein AFCA_007709 [Aspergillus flavus]|nr:hypothetical protein AFLA_002740 [Aspergillus flavus NRRL3357]UDD60298.1 hypothetical protein AFCA_007709 [Aspergillus flavus]